MSLSLYGPVVSHSQLTRFDDGKIDTFARFLAEKPSQDDLPKGPEDFLNEITFEGDESFQRNSESSVLNIQTSSVIN